MLSHVVKIAKIAHGLCFVYNTKLVAMATSFEVSEKLDLIKKILYLPFGEKIVKIGPVDTEIALLIVKKIKTTRNAWQSLVYIARSAPQYR